MTLGVYFLNFVFLITLVTLVTLDGMPSVYAAFMVSRVMK